MRKERVNNEPDEKNTTGKKLLALLLALIMSVSLLPMSVFAADLGTEAPIVEGQTQQDAALDESDGEEEIVDSQEPVVEDPAPVQEDTTEDDVDTLAMEGDVAVQAADTTFKYKILHLDCGRKYFSKNWIVALLNEMSAAGYNQLQLAFGNDGLRFLLNDMSFTANGTTYSHETVVSKVEAGNKAQNSSGDASWLTQTEMDEIIAAANALGIEIVPLLNLPGHANAILDIVDDAYNASGSNNTLNVVSSSDTARNFGLAIFKKYVDYFAGKGCQFFNFGADEYANDASGTFSFSRLSGTEYTRFVNFINSLAEYIEGKGMTPRAFNDGLYYNGKSASIDTDIQCCYWSSGWDGYNVAKANTIFGKGHSMINTHGDYYYVLGKDDAFTPDKTITHDAGLYTVAAGFKNTTFADGNTVSPVGSMFCIWCDYPNAETEQQVAANTRLVLRAMAQRMNGQSIDNMSTAVVANGFNADGTLNNSTGGETGGDTDPTTKDITLTVGQTSTEYTQDGDVAGNVDKTGYDSTVASYTAEYKKVDGKTVETAVTSLETGKAYYIKGTNGKYLDGNASWVDSIDDAAQWTWTGQYLQNGSNYLRYNSGSWTTTTNTRQRTEIYFSEGTFYRTRTFNGFDDDWNAVYSYSNPLGTPVTLDKTDPVNKTVITFTGKKVGNTSITIGNVKYNITVSAEDLTKVDPLTVEYWITNRHVTANGATSMTINADDVYKATGVKITDLVPATGVQDGNVVVYFKTVRLLSDNKQTDVAGVDKTREGDAIEFIRYWGGTWAFSSDGTTWTEINNTDQIVTYYLQKTDVTTEITTNVVDWGQPYSEWKAGTDNRWFWDGYVENGSKYVFLDFAVVYEDNTQNPASFPVDNTLFYHFDGCSATNPRVLGSISFTENDEYEIWKVTVTDGTSTGYADYSTFTPTYDDTTETTVWDTSMGGEPRVDQLTYTANRSGKLVRVYVRAKVTEDSLLVNYFVEGATDPFYHYNIAVAKGTYFNPGFAYVPATATDGAHLVNNTVKNIKNVTQTVQWDLSKMTQVGAQYRYSDYEFVGATRSDDGKTVNLYYTFSSTKTFVVDFGLPTVIKPTDMNENLGGAQVRLTKVTIAQKTTYADITVDDSNKYITYTLTKMIDGNDNFGVAYTGTIPKYDENGNQAGMQEGTVEYSITVIPASTVYYEDSFAKFYGSDGAEQDSFQETTSDDEMGKWYWDGKSANDAPAQALEALGGKSNVYGYDPAYNTNSTTFSMGSAKKVTVDASVTKAPTATFTFKGTGFDIISLTDNNSGAIVVDVVGKNSSYNESLLVNSYYGYVYNEETGEWKIDNTAQDNALYQIPVMKVTGLDYDEYTVTINVGYGKFFDKTGDSQYSFWMDAIRVYDPMGKDYADYTQDQEGYPQYIKLRDALASGEATPNENLLFIDGADKAEVTLYKNYGPNNEVYLAGGQAISFKLTGDLDKIATIQVGAKKPSGTGAVMTVNNENVSIANSATEMYYTITRDNNNCVTITNTGTDILSLTNLKVTFTSAGTVSLTKTSTQEQANAVAAVRALFTAPEPDPEPVVFAPEYFQATWNRGTVKVGQKATLTVKTSADVESVTVNGQDIGNYRVRTERTGWGWNAKKVTYHVFTFTVTATEAGTLDYSVIAANAEGVNSEAITATLTVQAAAQRPGFGGWLDKIFSRWF